MTHELDLKELRKVIEAGVTPGPWETVINCDDEDLPETVAVGSGEYLASGGANYRANDLILVVDTSSYEEGHELDEVLRRAKFIATFDPPTVLALLNRISEAEAERDFRQQENKELFDKLQAVRTLRDEWLSKYPDPYHSLAIPAAVTEIDIALDGEQPSSKCLYCDNMTAYETDNGGWNDVSTCDGCKSKLGGGTRG